MYRLWQKCVQIIKWPQCLRFKSVEEVFKNPHKTTFADFFCVDFMKFRGESVETRVENPHKTHLCDTLRHLGCRSNLPYFALILPQLEHNSVLFQIPTLPTLVHDPCLLVHASVILGNDRCCCNGDEKGLGAHHNSLRAYRLS